MPVIERNISYFFPTSPQSRQEAIEKNRQFGRQWVSTAIVEGRQRMKFCILTHEPDTDRISAYSPPPIYPKTKKLIPYAGKEK